MIYMKKDENTMKIAIYPGSFDPFTNGHKSILESACRLFDIVIVAVACDNNKKSLFTPEERAALIVEAVKELHGVRVDIFKGLLANYVCEQNAQAIIRGLRMVSDFEYEMQMAAFNRNLCTKAETVFFAAQPEKCFINSTFVRNIAELDGDISAFVPPNVMIALQEKYQKKCFRE